MGFRSGFNEMLKLRWEYNKLFPSFEHAGLRAWRCSLQNTEPDINYLSSWTAGL